MKKFSFSSCINLSRIITLFLTVLLFSGTAKAQIIAEWPLLKVKTGNALAATNVAAGITTGVVTYNQYTFGNTAPAATGLKLKTSGNSLVWPAAPDPTVPPLYGGADFTLNFPISSTTKDFTVTGLTMDIAAPTIATGVVLAVIPYYQIDGKGAWTSFGTAQTFSGAGTINFGTLNQPFFVNSVKGTGHTYVIKLCFYTTTPAVTTKSDYFSLANVIFNGTTQAATFPPAVNTLTATATGKYTGNSTGTYSFGATFQNPTKAGVTWSTTASPNIATSPFTTNGAGGTINSNITGLIAGTTYHVLAYVVTPIDTIYGLPEHTFTTDAPAAPILTTIAASNIASNKATSGGNISDSGGVAILQEGVCWSTISGAETATSGANFTKDGKASVSFSSIIKLLQPSTTYYVKAYARNSVGIGYATNEISFTTAAAVPVISAIPANLSFPTVVLGAPSSVLGYSLSGAYLSPAAGVITITPPAGFSISTSSSTGFVTTPLSVSYSNSTLAGTKIFVKQLTTSYGANTGTILHSGGGAVNPNIDTVTLNGGVMQDPDVLTNSGTDFWTGFGYEEKMSKKAGDPNEANISIYVSTGNQPATVHVDLPSAGYAQSFTIPANSVHEFTNFPNGDPNSNTDVAGLPDTRLYKTGISNKAIHIYTDNFVPVAAFLHTYTTGNSAAGAMLFPSNTWNSSYTVQAYGGTSNNSDPNSFFFVVANEDNTVVNFWPTQPVLDSSAASLFNSNQTTAANTAYSPIPLTAAPYSVTLNKGQIFNAMGGFGSNNNGLDLSGTVVKTSNCNKKIAVFGGFGRGFVNPLGCSASSGSDHLIQQMFPSVAWGTKYLTNPTKTEITNYYRIYINDLTTTVQVNKVKLGAANFTSGIYYEYESTLPLLIEGNKPISVCQFVTTPSCNTPAVNGGPEMLILSPIQQSITNATIYSAPFKTSGNTPALPNGTAGNCASYLNVIIPNSGVAGFTLDGKNTADIGVATVACSLTGNGNCASFSASNKLIPMASAFKQHPQDTGYSVATFWVSTAATHTLSSNVGFNAIAYGLGVGESYGYNAGTAIKDLTDVVTTITPFGTAPSAMTCKGNSTRINISLPYDTTKVSSIQWISSADSSVTPTNDTTSINAPLTTGSFVKDGVTYYTYQSPKTYLFDSVGTFKFNVTAFGTFTSECGGSKTFDIVMTVVRDTADFSLAALSCGSPTYNFTDITKTVSGDTLTKWQWTFGAFGNSNVQNPQNITFPAKAIYQVKLRTINNIGCFSDTVKTVDLTGGMVAKISATPDTVCLGSSITFDGSASTSSSGTITTYSWDFNDGTKVSTTTQTISHTYATASVYKATLMVATAAGCTSNLDTVSVLVAPIPVADFLLPTGICLPGNTTFINKSDTAISGQLTYMWDFGDAIGKSTNKDPVYAYTTAPSASGYSVKLIATSAFGCIGLPVTKTLTGVYAKPKAVIAPVANTCFGDSTAFTDASTAVNQTINKWKWDFGDANTSTLQNPKNKYTTVDSFTVTLIISTGQTCSDTTTLLAKINPVPLAGFKLPSSCLGSANATFTDTSSIIKYDGNQSIAYYSWSFGDPTSASNTSTAQNGQHAYTVVGSFPVKETVTSNNGCSASATTSFIIAGSRPVAGFTILYPTKLCSNLAVQIQDISKINLGVISRIAILWDTVNNPSSVTTYNSPAIDTIYSNKYQSLPTNAPYYVKLIATCGSSCSDTSAAQMVTVNGSPTVSFNITPSSICASSAPITINGASETSGPNGTPGFTYSGAGVNGTSFDPSKAVVGSNTIQAMYTTSAGCKDSATSTIIVKASVDLNFNPTSLKMCKTDSAQLIPISNTGIKFSWTETDAPQYTMSDSTARTPMVGPINDITTYTVFATNPAYCSATKSITVYASPYPQVTIINPAKDSVTICYGSTITLTAKTTSPNIVWTPADSLSTSNNLKSVIANPVDTTRYIVKVTDNSYCVKSVSDTVYVDVLPKLNVAVHVGSDTSTEVTVGDSLHLLAYIPDTAFKAPVTYAWSPSTYLDNTDTSSPILLAYLPLPNPDSLTYTVTATTDQGCTATTTFPVTFYATQPDILVPSAFAPNSDIAKNRIFVPFPIGIIHFGFFKVFNRAGQLVFSTNKIGEGWDGTIYGVPADPGTYVWMTDGIDYNKHSHPHSGTVVLLR